MPGIGRRLKGRPGVVRVLLRRLVVVIVAGVVLALATIIIIDIVVVIIVIAVDVLGPLVLTFFVLALGV